MQLDQKSERDLAELLGAKLMRVYGTQPAEGRAAILAFLHLVENDAARVVVHFALSASGQMHFSMKAVSD